MNVKLDIHQNNNKIEVRRESVKNWPIPDQVKKDIFKFLDDASQGQVNKGKPASERTQVKYINLLRNPLIALNKNINQLTVKDIEKYDKAIRSGEIQSIKRKPFSLSMKKDIRIMLRMFLQWKLGNEKATKLTDWFDTRDIKKTPDYLKESEIKKLYKACRNSQERFLIALLFDSGARAEEFHNIRYEDIELPEGNNNYVKLTLKSEYSKTEGRVISLYWENSIEAVSDYLNERAKEGIKSNDAVFNLTYDAGRFLLKRMGKRVLDKNLHFHLFRHSSATYYASRLNRQELCYRYGWKFSSDMPDVYISRAGMNSKDLDEKFTNTELGELKSKLAKEEIERKKAQDDIKKLNERLDKISKGLELIKT